MSKNTEDLTDLELETEVESDIEPPKNCFVFGQFAEVDFDG